MEQKVTTRPVHITRSKRVVPRAPPEALLGSPRGPLLHPLPWGTLLGGGGPSPWVGVPPAGKGAAPRGTGWGGSPSVAGRLRGCREGSCPAGLAVVAVFSLPVDLRVALGGKSSGKRQRSHCWEHLRGGRQVLCGAGASTAWG